MWLHWCIWQIRSNLKFIIGLHFISTRVGESTLWLWHLFQKAGTPEVQITQKYPRCWQENKQIIVLMFAYCMLESLVSPWYYFPDHTWNEFPVLIILVCWNVMNVFQKLCYTVKSKGFLRNHFGFFTLPHWQNPHGKFKAPFNEGLFSEEPSRLLRHPFIKMVWNPDV